MPSMPWPWCCRGARLTHKFTTSKQRPRRVESEWHSSFAAVVGTGIRQASMSAVTVTMPRAAVPKAATMTAGKSRFAGATVRAPRRAMCRAAARKQTVETLAYKVRVVVAAVAGMI
jgi:hypothetical protein